MPLTDNFVSDGSYNNEYIADISIFECSKCSLVQNPSKTDLSTYYADYEYSSGYSDFTKAFMHLYAESVLVTYKKVNRKFAKSVIEIGSGDGGQLLAFKGLGIEDLLGIEPSIKLSKEAEKRHIRTYNELFNKSIIHNIEKKYDICISSYTFDHIKSPVEYIKTAYSICNTGAILAIEIHDLEKIYERAEWCLFEHEHTIYMNQCVVRNIFSANGFEVIDINPIPEDRVRANSMIVIAKKVNIVTGNHMLQCESHKYDDISSKINDTINRIDSWIESLGADDLIGWGVGGRGVMTLAALSNHNKFKTIIDTNYITGLYSTPKTHIPVSGPDAVYRMNSSWCLVFSFGYFDEIKNLLIKNGFNSDKIISLEDFYG
jgi:hypothetical protein